MQIFPDIEQFFPREFSGGIADSDSFRHAKSRKTRSKIRRMHAIDRTRNTTQRMRTTSAG